MVFIEIFQYHFTDRRLFLRDRVDICKTQQTHGIISIQIEKDGFINYQISTVNYFRAVIESVRGQTAKSEPGAVATGYAALVSRSLPLPVLTVYPILNRSKQVDKNNEACRKIQSSCRPPRFAGGHTLKRGLRNKNKTPHNFWFGA
jgi:hypothetical protein